MTCPVPVISKLVPLLLGCYSGYAEGINDAGWVVGNCYDSNDSSNVSHPFVYNGSKTIDLNTQVVGWTLDLVTGINNSGQIVASGWQLSAEGEASSGWFLLTPAPFNMPNINAVLWAMLLGSGPAVDGGLDPGGRPDTRLGRSFGSGDPVACGLRRRAWHCDGCGGPAAGGPGRR